MYNIIEKEYKNKSPYNKVKPQTVLIYLVIFLMLILNNIFVKNTVINVIILMTIFVLGTFAMKKIYEGALRTKLTINPFKKNTESDKLDGIILKKEKEIFQELLIKEGIYNSQVVLFIVDHYRNLYKPKLTKFDFFTIMSLIISAISPFISQIIVTKGFSFKADEKAIVIYVTTLVSVAIFYFLINRVYKFINYIRCNDKIYERLELIFSELYFDLEKRKKYKTKKYS